MKTILSALGLFLALDGVTKAELLDFREPVKLQPVVMKSELSRNLLNLYRKIPAAPEASALAPQVIAKTP